jgi:hypothetical protein
MGPMGIHGIDCTVEVGSALLRQATNQWPDNVTPKQVGYAGILVG